MPNDQFGRPVKVGDQVTIKGEVVKVSDDPNFLNCTVKLAHTLPPTNSEVNLTLNTAQLELEKAAPPPIQPRETTVREKVK
jgi:hypothetical protein